MYVFGVLGLRFFEFLGLLGLSGLLLWSSPCTAFQHPWKFQLFDPIFNPSYVITCGGEARRLEFRVDAVGGLSIQIWKLGQKTCLQHVCNMWGVKGENTSRTDP